VQYASRSGIFRVEARERLLLKRREFITLLGGTAAAWPLPVRAQQAARLYRIGMLDHTSAALNAANLAGFRQGMRELGYVEGQSFVIEYRSADGRIERYPDLAAELVRLEVDAIVTRGTPAVLAAKNATSTIPIISAALAEPLLVVSSIRRPGGNVTGLSALTSELEAKRLELLREMIPGIVRIAVLYNIWPTQSSPTAGAKSRSRRDRSVFRPRFSTRASPTTFPARSKLQARSGSKR
jgi:putative ABC transport system substrate-binding protein